MGPGTDFTNFDIFISYAHIDNEPLVQGKEGWVSIFHKALETRFKQKFGYSPNIYRDSTALRGNDDFETALIRQLPKISALICVLSERYMDSNWCLRELRHFCDGAEDTGGLWVDLKTRIFKVEKAPVSLEQQFKELRSTLGYFFFHANSDKKHPRQFSPDPNASTYSDYVDTLDDLIDDINQLLQRLKKREVPEQSRAEKAQGTAIYLAETTFDRKDDRDRIKRELQRRGHVVLPDRQLPFYAPELETIVREELKRCELSIHLIGANYGVVPEAGDRSIIATQNELAAELSRKDPSFSRLIWMPPGMELMDDRQKQFVTYLKNNSEAQHGAEVLQTTFEDFKTIILDKITEKETEQRPSRQGKTQLIYLICDQPDLEAVAPIEAYLESLGYEVILPAFEGDEVQVRDDHRECLLICDAVIVFYGSANEFWVRTKLRELKKTAGYGRTKPMLARAIYCAAPETIHKQRFVTNEALLIQEYAGFSANSLNLFLADMKILKSARGGAGS